MFSSLFSPVLSVVLYQFLLFGLLFGSKIIQNEVIYPLETLLLNDRLVNFVSLVYLPHGVKVICVIFAGSNAILPLFVGSFLGFLNFGYTPIEAGANAVLGTLCVFLPLMAFNYAKESSLLSRLPIDRANSVNLFRTVIVFAFVATLVNAILRATLYADNGFDILVFRYVFGDMVGTLVILVLLLVLKKVLMAVGRYIHE